MTDKVPMDPVPVVDEGIPIPFPLPTNLLDKIAVNFFSITCFTMAMLLMIVISAATVTRYILHLDLYGYEEWIKIFAFWLYFMGAGLGRTQARTFPQTSSSPI